MKLVEFLIYLLEAQAQTLSRLAALFGEELFLHMLEESGDLPTPKLQISTQWFESAESPQASAYALLESSVHEFKLPAVLEFHLWAYPPYRSWIESDLHLNAKILGPGGDAGVALVEESISQANLWFRRLPIAEEFRMQAQSAAQVPWIKFRTSVLKRIGRRPLGPVY